MAKILSLIVIIFMIFACSISKKQNSNSVPSYSPGNIALHDTVSMLDSIFFEAYNNCRLYVFDSLISEDIEFYHDQGGFSNSKSGLIESLKNNICGKVSRIILTGSIEVYQIPNFGAVQFGYHRFINSQEPPNSTSRYSKFVHTWKRESTGWKLFRVISLH